jgi:hypothetical protein
MISDKAPRPWNVRQGVGGKFWLQICLSSPTRQDAMADPAWSKSSIPKNCEFIDPADSMNIHLMNIDSAMHKSPAPTRQDAMADPAWSKSSIPKNCEFIDPADSMNIHLMNIDSAMHKSPAPTRQDADPAWSKFSNLTNHQLEDPNVVMNLSSEKDGPRSDHMLASGQFLNSFSTASDSAIDMGELLVTKDLTHQVLEPTCLGRDDQQQFHSDSEEVPRLNDCLWDESKTGLSEEMGIEKHVCARSNLNKTSDAVDDTPTSTLDNDESQWISISTRAPESATDASMIQRLHSNSNRELVPDPILKSNFSSDDDQSQILQRNTKVPRFSTESRDEYLSKSKLSVNLIEYATNKSQNQTAPHVSDLSLNVEKTGDTIQLQDADTGLTKQPCIGETIQSTEIETACQKAVAEEESCCIRAEQMKQKSMASGANLLLELSKGKLKIHQLTKNEMDDMTMCLGGVPLPKSHNKQLRIEKLQALIKKSSETAKQSLMVSENVAVPDPAVQQTPLTAIELVCEKYGVNVIAKRLAEKLVRSPHEADDLFMRLQILDMLALLASSLQKPSKFTRNLHELSLNPNDNRAALAVRMDKFADLIEKSMLPMSEDETRVSQTDSTPKKKRGRPAKICHSLKA